MLSINQDMDYDEYYRYGDWEFTSYEWYFYQQPFLYTEGYDGYYYMGIGGGYWVFSERTDTLAGFGTTPILGRWLALASSWGYE